MGTRLEEPPKKDPDAPPESTPGTKPSTKCSDCGMENHPTAKFCNQCGESMAARPLASEDDGDKDGEKAKARAAALVATASIPALKSMVLGLQGDVSDVMAAVAGGKSRTALGAKVEAIATDAAKVPRLRAERDALRLDGDRRERIEILKALADGGIHPRGEVLIDVLHATTGKPTGEVRPARLWSDGPEGRTMANLRSYATAKMPNGDTTSREASPYGAPPPSPDAAAALARGPVPAVAKSHPAVRMAARAGVAEDEAASIMAREFGGAS